MTELGSGLLVIRLDERGCEAVASLLGGRASVGSVGRRQVLGRPAVGNGETVRDSGRLGGCCRRLVRPSTFRNRFCSCSSRLSKRTSERALLLGGSTNRGDRGDCVCECLLRGVEGGLVGDEITEPTIGQVVEERSQEISRT
ncbi:unnamed protein product [Dicrocoelium dendriticum]|nr:unnamed protein product [Dicrocoelium dendriticum]